ncbi:MAG TPA: hypothetical protein VNN79_13435 [Actinomycetota bacterium]|nr:hypothetical protein [Actinomycetota bacterium]
MLVGAVDQLAFPVPAATETDPALAEMQHGPFVCPVGMMVILAVLRSIRGDDDSRRFDGIFPTPGRISAAIGLRRGVPRRYNTADVPVLEGDNAPTHRGPSRRSVHHQRAVLDRFCVLRGRRCDEFSVRRCAHHTVDHGTHHLGRRDNVDDDNRSHVRAINVGSDIWSHDVFGWTGIVARRRHRRRTDGSEDR